MTRKELEMTLSDFLQSKWFVAGARTSAIVGGIVISIGGMIIGYAVFDTRSKAENAVSAAAAVVVAQGQRSAVVDAKLAGVDEKISDMQSDLDLIRSAQNAQLSDLATVKGILQQMQRENSLAATALR